MGGRGGQGCGEGGSWARRYLSDAVVPANRVSKSFIRVGFSGSVCPSRFFRSVHLSRLIRVGYPNGFLSPSLLRRVGSDVFESACPGRIGRAERSESSPNCRSLISVSIIRVDCESGYESRSEAVLSPRRLSEWVIRIVYPSRLSESCLRNDALGVLGGLHLLDGVVEERVKHLRARARARPRCSSSSIESSSTGNSSCSSVVEERVKHLARVYGARASAMVAAVAAKVVAVAAVEEVAVMIAVAAAAAAASAYLSHLLSTVI